MNDIAIMLALIALLAGIVFFVRYFIKAKKHNQSEYIDISASDNTIGVQGVHRALSPLDKSKEIYERARKEKALLSECTAEEANKGYYSVLQDMGLGGIISFQDFVAAGGDEDAMMDFLYAQGKRFSLDWKWGPDELLWSINKIIPEFNFSFKGDEYYKKYDDTPRLPQLEGEKSGWLYQGDVGGEAIDMEVETLANFAIDVVNPILARKFNQQLMFLTPGGDAFEFVVVPSESVERLRVNKFFGNEEFKKNVYGYKDR